MPTILDDTMTDTEILQTIAGFYADPLNWEWDEKDFGSGRPVPMQPIATKYAHTYARTGLDIIANRKKVIS